MRVSTAGACTGAFALILTFASCHATTTGSPATQTAAGSVAGSVVGSVANAHARAAAIDARAKETEQRMTDEERFALLFSVFGANAATGTHRDSRIPANVANSAGYTPGIPRLGVPALRSTDASMGVTNPGYRPDDQGATALPASILVG